jgi:pimeloyl-ACP methyl ester carboxylesterase
VIDHPIFVPYEGAHLAAVLTLPDSHPRGVVLMVRGLPGRITARIAWALADAGIASLRLDAPGRGDSTGTFRSGREASAVPWVAAAMETVTRATGVDRVAMVGYCQAAATAVEAAAELPSVSTVLIVVRGGAFRGARSGATPTDGPLGRRMLRGIRRLGRVVVSRIRGRGRSGRIATRAERATRRPDRRKEVHPRHLLMQNLARAGRSTDILALHIGDSGAAPGVERRAAMVREAIGPTAHRFEIRHLPPIARGFRIPSERLNEVASTLAGWLDEVIDRPVQEPDREVATQRIDTSSRAERVV